MHGEEIIYQCHGIQFKGYLAYDMSYEGKRPAVIVAHGWTGQGEFTRKKAEALAELGYIGFAIDMYGDAKTAANQQESEALMSPLFMDRKLLQERILAAYETVSKFRLTDSNKIGAIGFCFGGLVVVELYRSGAPVSGVVSFHGVLVDSLFGFQAKKVPLAPKISGSLLVLHGYKDPLTPQDDLLKFEAEMNEAGVDWQLLTYGQACHAFTNPKAKAPDLGRAYDPLTDHRSWQSMRLFFKEVFHSLSAD